MTRRIKLIDETYQLETCNDVEACNDGEKVKKFIVPATAFYLNRLYSWMLEDEFCFVFFNLIIMLKV